MMEHDANLVLLAFGAALVLESLLGVDLIAHAAKKTDVALRLAAATAISALLVVPAGHLVLLAIESVGVLWVRLPLLLVAVFLATASSAALLAWVRPGLARSLHAYYPLLLGTSLLLGCVLVSARATTPVARILEGYALAAGFCILCAVFGYLQQRLTTSNIPKAFRGAPVTLISLGILALAFQGFAG